MVIATNPKILEELGEPKEGYVWLVDIDTPDFIITAQALKGTYKSRTYLLGNEVREIG